MPGASPVGSYGTLHTSFEDRELYHDLLRCDAMGPSTFTFERFFRKHPSRYSRSPWTTSSRSEANSHHDTFDNLSEQERCPVASSMSPSSGWSNASTAYDLEKAGAGTVTACSFLTGVLAFFGACSILCSTVAGIVFSAVGLAAGGLNYEVFTSLLPLLLPFVLGAGAATCLCCAVGLIAHCKDGLRFRTALWNAFWGVEKYLLASGFVLDGLSIVMCLMDKAGGRG